MNMLVEVVYKVTSYLLYHNCYVGLPWPTTLNEEPQSRYLGFVAMEGWDLEPNLAPQFLAIQWTSRIIPVMVGKMCGKMGSIPMLCSKIQGLIHPRNRLSFGVQDVSGISPLMLTFHPQSFWNLRCKVGYSCKSVCKSSQLQILSAFASINSSYVASYEPSYGSRHPFLAVPHFMGIQPLHRTPVPLKSWLLVAKSRPDMIRLQ